ncbi:MAG: hypothetical protein GX783_09350, partial [Clostridiales bacterium]|nr:hypothetical protein [Clostridiales bacterium]
MHNEQILNQLKRSVDQAPIDMLDRIKSQPVAKMIQHDDITRQSRKRVAIMPMVSFASIAAVLLLFINF